MIVRQSDGQMRTRPCQLCYLCGSQGQVLYQGLRDHAFGIPGKWSFLHCPKCQVIWLDPQPLPEDIGVAYKGYQTHKVLAEKRKFPSIRSSIKRAILTRDYGYTQTSKQQSFATCLGTLLSYFPMIREAEGMSIMGLSALSRGSLLDVGCGNGLFITRMRNLGWQVRGTEIDREAVAVARQEFGLEVFVGALEDAHYPDNSFDVITLSHVVEHIYYPIELLKECRRILKSGGRLIITTPNIHSLGHKMFAKCWRGLEPPRHLIIFSPNSLELCTRRAGFDTIVIRSSARMGYSLYLGSKRILSQESGSSSPVVSQQESKVLRLAAYLFQIAEETIRFCFREVGEEIYFVGVKTDESE